MLLVYVSFFNVMLSYVIVPKLWSESMIIPIYKNKRWPKVTWKLQTFNST